MTVSVEGFNAEMLRFLSDACSSLDTIRDQNDETKSFMYLGRAEIKMEGEVVGYLNDLDGIGYTYESKGAGEPSA